MVKEMAKNWTPVVLVDKNELAAYDYKLLNKSDDYLKTGQKCKLASDLSNVTNTKFEDEQEVGRRSWRKRRGTNQFLSSDNSSLVPEKRQHLTVRKQEEGSESPASHTTSSSPAHTSSSKCNSSTVEPVNVHPALWQTPSRRPASQASSISEQHSVISHMSETPQLTKSGCSSGTARPLSEYNFQLKVFQAIEEIKVIAKNNMQMLQILHSASCNRNGQGDDGDVDLSPAATDEELASLDERLSQSSDFKKKIVKKLSTIGGKNLQNAINLMMPRVITNHLAKSYSFHGRKGNKVFKAYKSVVDSVIKAVRKNIGAHSTCSDAQIILVIGNWLRHAKHRKDGAERADVEEEEATLEDLGGGDAEPTNQDMTNLDI